MCQSKTYDVMTDHGCISIMLIDETIIASRDRGDVVVHHVPARNNGGPVRLGQLFRGLHVVDGLIVGPIPDPTTLMIGFYNADPDTGMEWGYVWNVDDPDQSYWKRSEQLAGLVTPANLPMIGHLANLGLRVASLIDDTATADPRAVALAVGEVADREYEADCLANLLSWLAEYRRARMRHYVTE